MNSSELRKFAVSSFKIFCLGFVIGFFMCPNCYKPISKVSLLVSSFSGLIWVALWQGNGLVQHTVDQYIDWLKAPAKRFFIGLVATTLYTTSAVYFIMFLFSKLLPPGWRLVGFSNETLIFSIAITLIIWFFLTGKQFLAAYRQEAVNAEKLKTEFIISRFESLKNQVNPHFLFNSLNALSNLIYQDTELSAKFIKQLAEVYRYVLDTRTKDLVDIAEELKFLKAYLFLQDIRFGNKLKVDITIPDSNIKIAPVVLQMLVENAIKHNIISEEEHLIIRITQTEEYLIVENNLQKRSILADDSVGIGLDNIVSRYQLLSPKPVIIEEEKDRFSVSIPLIY
jgi:hypothetical protein